MSDLPPNSAPDAAEPADAGDASTDSPPARRPLPRAARLSRLTAPAVPPPVTQSPAITPPAAVEPSVLTPDPTVADPAPPSPEPPVPIRPAPTQPAATAAMALPPQVPRPPRPATTSAVAPGPVPSTPAQRPATVQSRPAEPISRPAAQLVELVAADASTPSAAVAAAQQAAATAAARPSEPVVFKPLDEVMATRSVILSGIGIVFCFFPVLSLAGLLMGVLAQRRIQRSNGALTGRGSARWGILLGAVGLVVGATADTVFLLRR